jgi:CheY-like chemotaxis protein
MSDYMLRIYKAVFSEIENETTKDFGTSKLTLRLANSLLKLLSGEYKSVEQEKDKSDFNFIFPIEFSKTDVVVESDESEPQQEENITEETKEENPISKEIEEEFTNTHDIDEEVTIPEEQPVEIMDSGTGKFELSNYRCLYIEDQVDSQILFKVQMKELKEIKFAVGFEEALPLLDNEIFDFIVMDINLQGEYNGLDALKIIQKMPGYENIPIIAATAYVLPGDKEKFIAAGFNDFISKPIFREKMVEALKKIFSMQV